MRPSKGRHPPSHRKARPVPSSGRARGLSAGGPQTASQELFWPSRVGRCEGPPHSYVRMPFGLPSAASAYQRNSRRTLVTQEARHHAVLAEMETVFREPLEPLEPPEAQGPGGS